MGATTSLQLPSPRCPRDPQPSPALLPTEVKLASSPRDTEVSLGIQIGVRWAGTAFYTLVPTEVTVASSPTGYRAGQVLAGLSTQGHTGAILFGGPTGQCCSGK